MKNCQGCKFVLMGTEKLCKGLLEKEFGGTAKITATYLMYPDEKGATGEEVVSLISDLC